MYDVEFCVVIVFSNTQLSSKLFFFWGGGDIKQRHDGHAKSATRHFDLIPRTNYSLKIVMEIFMKVDETHLQSFISSVQNMAIVQTFQVYWADL
jgi:hypothetical protein